MIKKGLVVGIVILFLGVGIQPVFANEVPISTTSVSEEDCGCQDEYMTIDILDIEASFRSLDDKSAICSVLGELLELFTSMGYKYPVLWDYFLQDLCYDIINLGVMWECWEYSALFIAVGIQPAFANEISISTTSDIEEDCNCNIPDSRTYLMENLLRELDKSEGFTDLINSNNPLSERPICDILNEIIQKLWDLDDYYYQLLSTIPEDSILYDMILFSAYLNVNLIGSLEGLGIQLNCWPSYNSLFIGVGIQPVLSNEVVSISTTSDIEEDCGCQSNSRIYLMENLLKGLEKNEGSTDLINSNNPLSERPICDMLNKTINRLIDCAYSLEETLDSLPEDSILRDIIWLNIMMIYGIGAYLESIAYFLKCW